MRKPGPSESKDQARKLPGQRISTGRLCLFAGAIAVVMVFVYLSFFGGEATNKKSATSAPATARPINSESERPAIESVRLRPAQPSRLDTLKAEIAQAGNPNGNLTYTYVWKVNHRVIEGAEKDTLELAVMKKRDLVTVTVTPHRGGIAGFPVESPAVALHSAPPTLELKPLTGKKRPGGTIELQLIGQDPDGGAVTFSLESPLVPGMSIDGSSGKITWIVEPNQKGTVRFRAAATNADQTKITKIFNLTVQ